jgi:hypothetical protein
MDQESFYKDQYDKSLAGRTDINSSISTPIGILTALLAGLYFCATNFDYNDAKWLTSFFMAVALLSSALLLVAIIYLILAFADFLKDRSYIYLNDADVLDAYYESLIASYTQSPPATPATAEGQAKADFDEYLLGELIRNAANNQRINRIKTALLFQSHKFMIYAIIAISLLIIPFAIDFGRNKGKDKVQRVKIEQALPVDLTIKYQKDTSIRLTIKPNDHGQANTKHHQTHPAAIPGH